MKSQNDYVEIYEILMYIHVYVDMYVRICTRRFVCTGSWRLIGCLMSQVIFIFCKRAINYRVLLRKLTWTDKASYESSPPCSVYTWICRYLRSIYSRKYAFTKSWVSLIHVLESCVWERHEKLEWWCWDIWNHDMVKTYVSFAKEPYKRDS